VVSALATGQRNLAAAVVLTLVGALVTPIVLILLAGELGRRTAEPTAAAWLRTGADVPDLAGAVEGMAHTAEESARSGATLVGMTARWSDPHRAYGSPTGSEKDAAHRLGRSHSTMKHHLANAQSKVGATTMARLVWI
jgi:hypothetical protein